LLLSLGGALLFGGVFLLFHIARAMGAGDVKLAGAMGCIAGLPGSLQLMVATVFAGGALAFIYMVVSGREMQTLRNTFNVIAFHARHGVRAHPLLNLENPGALRMPYALAFATGTLYWALMMHSWR
jgi:Flp pilus assembly protein protease CpaA